MSLIEIRITAPDAEVADRIARRLVEGRLAACVQQLPGLTSTYVWEGEVEQASEILLLAKTRGESFEAVCAAVTAIHPYEVPEIVAVPVATALGSYESWVEESVRHP
ncbi:MAG: divalent-cation tolerance protein CutA [Dermatophilaceae bacterium]